MAEETALTEQAAREILSRTGESDGIDCKGVLTWDRAEHSARLTKDIIAFANSRGGGVLVIGKAERDDGSFAMTGLTEPESASFDSTEVAKFVNDRTSSPVRLSCCPVSADGKRFVLIRVAEFDDVPVLCTRAFDDPKNTKSKILRDGALYVRNANVESAVLSTSAELRALIGLATAKQRDQIAAQVRAVLTGASIIPPPPPEELYAADKQLIESELSAWLDRVPAARAAWRFDFYPTVRRQRWGDEQELRTAARGWLFERQGSTYPVVPEALRIVEGCVVGEGDLVERFFAVTPNGYCTVVAGFNDEAFAALGPPGGRTWKGNEGGPVVRAAATLDTLGRFFLFLSEFAKTLAPDDRLAYRAAALGVKGRTLWTDNIHIAPHAMGAPPLTKDPTPRSRELVAGAVTAEWRDECATLAANFFGAFRSPHGAISAAFLRRLLDLMFGPTG